MEEQKKNEGQSQALQHEPREIVTRKMGTQLVQPDIQVQDQAGLELLQERARVAKEALKISIASCSPGQIVVMDGGSGKQTLYFTGGASDRILRSLYGMRWGDAQITLSVDKEGDQVCEATATLYKYDGQPYQNFTGTRRMGGFVHNEQDLIKGAKENMKHQAVTDILGTRFLTPSDLKDLGLDVDKLERRASFQEHGKDESGGMVVPFGNKKGQLVSSLDERELNWYIEKAKASIADPTKSKFKPQEEKRLKVYEEHLAALKNPKPPAAAAGEAAHTLSAEDAAKLEGMLIEIREQLQAAGKSDAEIDAGLEKIKTIAQAAKQLEKLKAGSK